MNIQYCFRKGSFITGVNPEDAAQELSRIHNENGILTPDLVLEEAQSESNPLHNVFEWDNEVAAHNYRKSQATQLIYSVQVVREDAPPEPVYIHSKSSNGYLPSQKVVSNINLYEEAYRKALGRVGDAENSLRQLERLAELYQPDVKSKINIAANTVSSVRDLLNVG